MTDEEANKEPQIIVMPNVEQVHVEAAAVNEVTENKELKIGMSRKMLLAGNLVCNTGGEICINKVCFLEATARCIKLALVRGYENKIKHHVFFSSAGQVPFFFFFFFY